VVINGIFFRTRTGCPWRDLPEGFGNWKTVYNRHRRWSGDGTWREILDRLRAGCDEAEGKDWTLSADSAVVRAHQHAAGARRALPADLLTGGQRRMTRTRRAGRAGRRWAAPAAG
jgi:transposase